MFETLIKIKEFWNEYSFEITTCFLLVFFLFGALYNKLFGNGKGSWSNQFIRIDKEIERIKNGYNSVVVERDVSQSRGRGGDSKGELECRRVLEKIFQRPFRKIRPDFLRNNVNGGHNLEIDCFNQELRLGLEYHGRQHYEYVEYFHRNKEDFLNQKYRDEMKRQRCRDHGINLIEVPHKVKIHEIESYIINELRKMNYL